MHLLTTKGTVFWGFTYGLAILCFLASTVGYLIEGDILRFVVFFALLFSCGASASRYIQAFRRRVYDRQYAVAKDELWNTLTAALPSKGEISFKRGDVDITLERDKILRFVDWFGIQLTDEGDSSYDEETMTRQVVKPRHYLQVNPGTLFVSKSYDALIVRSIKHDTDEDGVDLTITVQSTGSASVRATVKSRQKLPADLLYASIDELNELSGDIKNYINGTVS